jgi:hypothetical protein
MQVIGKAISWCVVIVSCGRKILNWKSAKKEIQGIFVGKEKIVYLT